MDRQLVWVYLGSWAAVIRDVGDLIERQRERESRKLNEGNRDGEERKWWFQICRKIKQVFDDFMD